MNTQVNNKICMNKSMVVTAIILTATFSFSLQADESYKGDPIIVNQFIQIDTDGNGFVTKQEVAAQPELTKRMELYVEGSFEMGDINSDGVLDWAEFLANEEEISAE